MKSLSLVGFVLGSCLCFAFTATAADLATEQLDNWHHWRGPLANGVAPNAKPPLNWDADTNIKWKTEITGSGTSTPIIWGDKIFLTTAIDTKLKPQQSETEAAELKADDGPPQPPRTGKGPPRRGGKRGGFRGFGGNKPETIFQFMVLCLDRKSGDILWKQIATEAVPHEGHHRDHGYASGSATTDGQSLFVTFGSRGIYSYDLDGNLQWGRDLGGFSYGVPSKRTTYRYLFEALVASATE